MICIKTKAHVGSDGVFAVQVPIALRETDVEALLVLQPLSESQEATNELGWPIGFFKRTAGAWQGEILERLPQGEAEEREVLL